MHGKTDVQTLYSRWHEQAVTVSKTNGTCFVKDPLFSTVISACSWSRKAYAWHGLSLHARRDLAYNLSENDVDVYGSCLAHRSLMIMYNMMRRLPIMQDGS